MPLSVTDSALVGPSGQSSRDHNDGSLEETVTHPRASESLRAETCFNKLLMIYIVKLGPGASRFASVRGQCRGLSRVSVNMYRVKHVPQYAGNAIAYYTKYYTISIQYHNKQGC